MGKEFGARKPWTKKPQKQPKLTGMFYDAIGGKLTAIMSKPPESPQQDPGPKPGF